MFTFKEENSFSKRLAEVQKISSKWPDRIPIILEKAKTSRLEDIPKNKFLCPPEYTVQQFLGCIRKKVKLSRDTALFVFVNGTELVSGDASMKNIYDQKKDEDGFLYMIYSDQEVMGN
mmetsp:Transcript_2717/g.4237  ORF Transcript_2717/g.4237 Transcript_2717/m.4237 type:complete len:118 (+) Transcript_2717:36-389(+)